MQRASRVSLRQWDGKMGTEVEIKHKMGMGKPAHGGAWEAKEAGREPKRRVGGRSFTRSVSHDADLFACGQVVCVRATGSYPIRTSKQTA